MAIFKTVKEEKFVTIHNEFFDIETLSFTAKGLLGYIITKPNDWKIRKTDLIKKSSGGKTQVESALLELMAHGFMNWYPKRNEDGTIDQWVYEVYEMPYMNPNKEECIREGQRRIAEKKAKTKAKNAKKQGKPLKADNPIVDKSLEADNLKVDNLKVDNPPMDNPPYSNKDVTKKDFTKKDFTNTYSSLSIELVDMVTFFLQRHKFEEKEINKSLKLIADRKLFNLTADDITAQLQVMKDDATIKHPAIYFVNGLEMNLGKARKKVELERERQEKAASSSIPFYNWLEE
jgi:hypothetical protein